MLSSIALSLSAVAKNPFDNGSGGTVPLYVQPSYAAELQSSIASSQGLVHDNLQVMANTSTAFWVDTKAKIPAMSSMLQQAATKSPPELVTIVVYDVPNRDCASNNSVGDICCYYYPDGSCNREKDGDCSAGLADYDTNFIAPIAAELAKYEGKMPIVLIIEPDSLPNIATNQGVAACASTATQAAYTKGIQYAITTISQKAPSVTMYLDAAHGNWVRPSRTATHARRARSSPRARPSRSSVGPTTCSRSPPSSRGFRWRR